MGRNLTNLYISQSFEYLVQLSGSELQNGLGSTLTGSLLITASRADNATSASFASTALSSSYAVTASYALNAGATVSTASLLTTASANANIITFTKGDGSTFPVTIATGSAVSASYATTASLALNNVLTSSTNNDTITFTKGDGTTYTNVINNVSASISASRAISAATADTATTASYVLNAVSASYAVSASQAQNAISSSYAVSASQAQNAVSASFATTAGSATTASFATNFTASNLLVTGLATINSASITNLTVVYETSSVIYSSGSNQFGDAANDTQTLYGTVDIKTGPLKVTGSVASTGGFTGSLVGTASYANNALSSSYAVTASYALTANVNTGSLLTTASAAGNVVTFTKGDGSTFPVTVATGSASAFPFTGSARITGSLSVTGSTQLGGTTINSVGSQDFLYGGSDFNIGIVGAQQAIRIVGGEILFGQLATRFDQPAGFNNNVRLGDALTDTHTVTGSLSTTGSISITGSLTVSSSAVIGTNLTDGPVKNGILSGFGNTVYGPTNGTFLLAGGGQINSGVDYSAMIGGYGHRLNYGYSHVFGGTYNYIGYNSPGSSGDVYAAGIFGGASNTINGWRSNNQTILGGSGNQIYTYNGASDFEPNVTIVGGTGNYISGSFTFDNTIIGGRNNFIGSNISRSAIIGGSNITASQNDTTYVPNLRATGSIIQEGSSTSANPAMILASGSGRPLYFYAGGGINPTFDVESNQAIYHWVAGGAQTYQVMGLNNAWYFGYNWGGTPTVEFNANNYGKFYNGLHVTGGLQVSGAVVGNVIGNDTDTYTSSAPVQQIVTLTQTEYNAISSPNANTLYIISGSNPTSYATTGSNTFYGNQTFSGSVRGVVISSSISSNTASLDFSTANFFRLNTANVLNTHIVPTNIVPGQTVNLELTYPATASAITFPSFVKQPSGSAYVSSGAGTTDILTFIAFTTSSVYLSSVKNMI